jgi:hypothetical protein
MGDDQKTEMLKEVFSQYWQHVRHQETQRFTFLTTYAIITAGIFAFVEDSGVKTLLLLFVILLSVIGILVTIAWRVAFYKYLSKANKVLVEGGLKDFLPTAKTGAKKPLSAHKAFLCFYNLILSASAAWIIWFQSDQNIRLAIFISIAVLLGFSFVTFRVSRYFEKPFKEEKKETT